LLADVRRAVNVEWERLRRPERSKHTLDESRHRLRDVSARLAPPPAPEPPGAARPVLVAGARVSADHLGVSGEIVSIAGATATVRSGAITVRVPLAALRAVATDASPAPRAPVDHARHGAITVPDRQNVATEIHLLGRTTDEARDLVEQYLDDAFVAGLGRVRLIHGKGTGALRKAVRALLAAHPLVQSFRDGEPSEGGPGATVAELKVS
jgi:DNA mismatch repair protein MutS2